MSSLNLFSLADALSLKNTTQLQTRLKKEIGLKFQNKLRRDETNKTSLSTKKRNSSLVMHNPLAKSSFSLDDTVTHKGSLRSTLEPVKKAVRAMMGSKQAITHSYR